MKKIIGILGVAVIAAAMFFSANTVNGATEDSSLTDLLTINSANAECLPYNYGVDAKCLTLSQICVGDAGSGKKECAF